MTPSKQPELPALTEEELAESLRKLDFCLDYDRRFGVPHPEGVAGLFGWFYQNASRLFEQARRCLSAERELRVAIEWAERMAYRNGVFTVALDSNFRGVPFLGLLEEELKMLDEWRFGYGPEELQAAKSFLAGPQDGLAVRTFKAERSLSEVKTERDELKAKVGELERHLSECRFKLSEYGV